MRYNPGDYVIIRSWDSMADEFDLLKSQYNDNMDNIVMYYNNNDMWFTYKMRDVCDSIQLISSIDDDIYRLDNYSFVYIDAMIVHPEGDAIKLPSDLYFKLIDNEYAIEKYKLTINIMNPYIIKFDNINMIQSLLKYLYEEM